MPHWICDSCGTRVYSASESLRWQGCPVCAGRLEPEAESDGEPAAPASQPPAR